ncbi:hypothetical protein LUZ62_086064 [Rhynchospora pubera]|uniref:Pentatricopeptide repeat-containing protein n=1 Tax=Rhynchospora pubera TaxID=906938 RepID=A0AAV8C9Y9_9POAL|nr:hypothetical protein LUZ62_086064 [Rhynchospora pubera]
MVDALPLAPFASLLPSASQSQSSLAFRHRVCHVRYAVPQSKSDFPENRHRIAKKPKPQPTTTNFPSNSNLRKKERNQHLKGDIVSTQEVINKFHHLVLQNTPTSIYHFNQLLTDLVRTKTSRIHPDIFSLYNYLQIIGVTPDKYTYGYMIQISAKMNRLDLAFVFLGQLLKEGHRPDAVIFSPILKCLCSGKRIGEAAAMVLGKMPKLGSVPNVVSYSILIKGLCSNAKAGFALQLLFKMIKTSGVCEPNVIS